MPYSERKYRDFFEWGILNWVAAANFAFAIYAGFALSWVAGL
jgi:hypothetical protein